MRFELGKLELFGLDLNALLVRWWRGLNTLFPVSLSGIFLRPAPRVVAELVDEQLRLRPAITEAQCSEEDWLRFSQSEFALLEDSSLRTQLLGEHNSKQVQLDLVLPAGSVLRRMVSVPAAARHELRQMLGFQISRLTPFTREQVYFDVVELDGQVGGNMLQAELLVIPKSFVEPWLQQTERVTGLPVARLQVPTTQGQSAVGNLLGGLGVSSGWWRRLNLNSVYTMLLLAVLAVAVITPALKWRFQLVQVKSEIVEQSQRLADVRKDWYELQDKTENLSYLLRQHATYSRTSQILSELTRLVPDTVFLTALVLEKDRVEISGQGTDVVEVVEILNASELFTQARFASAVTRSRDNRDVFTISMQLVDPGELP